jgi:tetratricopeptide (TPR) repeat protein
MASSLQKGINSAKAGNMREALDFLKDAIIEEPQNADVWVWIAAIIDDLDKQEIFLEKAIDIDPNNIPAQRGLAYLQQRKREEASVMQDHLSDHTQPISPFPSPQKRQEAEKHPGWTKISEDELEEVVEPAKPEPEKPHKSPKPTADTPKLSLFEFTLLGVIVVVFCFIGLLAASSIFEFELPIDFILGNKPSLAAEPPYPGVFLYENGMFFDIQEYQGIPTSDLGMPTSFEDQPVVVFWQTPLAYEKIAMIYQNGSFIPFDLIEDMEDGNLIQPNKQIKPGLYCLQAPSEVEENPYYWCFKVEELPTIQ